MKAVILTRVSTKMQEEGLSLTAQSNRLFDYAERKGLEVIKTFEIIESSTHGERKQFMEMIAFCKRQHETIAIIADTVDRVQRSFKESVLLDELMKQNKIELHFYREGMILNSQSSSVDIMRWDFSVMGAKAYVLQLAENIRRSNEQKNKNGEITGFAPIGYENYINEHGKKFVRPKEPEASIIKQLFEIYSLGHMGVTELAKYAHMLGLKSRTGQKMSKNSMYGIINNPFYYGEMRTKRGLIRHIYPPLITKELWDLCQEKKAEHNLNVHNPKITEKPFILRGLIRCGLTNQMCICEIKKNRYIYIFCYHADGSRQYVPEQNILNDLASILNRIHLPDNIVAELKEELKKAKANERKYCRDAVVKLKKEQETLKDKLDHLFDLRLDGELDRETFDTKRNELQLKVNRVKNKILAHEKADESFNSTLLELLDIATEAGYLFSRSQNIELKRFLLKFVFKNLWLTEGKLTYELNFPFEMFEEKNIKRTNQNPLELVKPLEIKGYTKLSNQTAGNDNMDLLELQFSDKKQRVRPENLTRVLIGERVGIRTRDPLIKSQMLYRLSYAPIVYNNEAIHSR